MDKAFDHKKYESEMYSLWEKSGAFSPLQSTKNRSPFTIIMPPPNANDPLHIGHAMFVTIEDILIRYHRMLGEPTLWLPGTDHAGIETQFVFEKKLAKGDKSRFDFDRATLYKMIWNYVQENSGVAIDQMKRLGASADWSRYKFTLDPDVVNFVTETFVKLNKDGLIYRGERLVNYCTKCGTGYSELEVNHIEETAKLYFVKYGPFTLATTRPETKFADTAVAIHPKDNRYKKYVGKEIEVDGLLGKFKLKVIADKYVDPKFGTGVVKITPLHDFDDYEVWQRHKDEIPEPKQVIGLDGKLTEVAGKYAGLKVKTARDLIEKDLSEKGLLTKPSETYKHNVGTCYRCGTILEPLPLPQFFIKVKEDKTNLVKNVLEALDKKETVVLGTGRDKILRNWLKNLKDWNISRRIVWGIRIPVWYSTKNIQNLRVEFKYKDIIVGGEVGELTKPSLKSGPCRTFKGNVEIINNEKLESKEFSLTDIKSGLQSVIAPINSKFVVSIQPPDDDHIQETDTFDTWFSSGQWPVVTLKTNNAEDFQNFYPTSVMETGYDILPFWVMRMMILGIYLTGKSPFKTVYLHGLIRDEQGRKMSKSVGNVINPLDMVDKYGADALRMALVMSSTPGQDKNVGETQIRGMRNFSNKIWNAARYVFTKPTEIKNAKNDKLYKEKMTKIIKETTKYMDLFKIGLAAEKLYNYFWHWYCDKCIEENKKGLISDKVLSDLLNVFITLLHPFMPFVTESIRTEMSRSKTKNNTLILAEWPMG